MHDGELYTQGCSNDEAADAAGWHDVGPPVPPSAVTYVLGDAHAFHVDESPVSTSGAPRWTHDWASVLGSSIDGDVVAYKYRKAMLGIIEKLAQHVHQYGSRAVLFQGMDMKLINTSGYNDDCRGSDRCLIQLPFETTALLRAPFTLAELIQATFRLKSHKFDFWYELFTRASVQARTGKRPSMHVKMVFDHGS